MSAAAASTEDGKFPPALIALMLVVFINLVGFGVVVPLLPFFARAMNAAEWQVTLVFAAYSMGQFIGEPFWGRLSDRIGRKPVLLVTILFNVAGYFALAFAPNVWVAIVVRLITGFGAGNISTVQAYIADVTPPEKRSSRMGLIGAAFGLGFIVGPGLGGLLTHAEQGRLGFQIPLFVAGALAAVAALCVMLFLRESRTHAPPAQSPWAAMGDALNNPAISRVLLVSLIYMGGFSGMEAAFGLWAEARFGWGAPQVGWCFMCVGIVSAFSQATLTGRLARRFGEANMLTFGVLLFGAMLALQTVNTNQWLVPVLMGIGTFGMSMAMPNISSIISQASPPGRQGSMLGLNMAASSGARVIGPIIAGVTYSSLGHNWPFLMGAALTIPAAIVALNAGRVLRAARAAPDRALAS